MRSPVIYLVIVTSVLWCCSHSKAENQSSEATGKNGSAKLDCYGIKGKLKKDCRPLAQKIDPASRSAENSMAPRLTELSIDKTILITSSVKLPEDI